MGDKIKFLLAALIVAGALGAFYYYGEDTSLLLRVLGLLVAIGVASAVFFQTAAGQHTWAFIGEARTEVRKVVWPTRKETIQTTLVVMGMVLVTAVILWIFDSFLTWLVKLFTGQGG
ncbi:MAG: preprotein translocase subunit SecE [Gammaproteobacteria bacterium]|nr:preprotein translocase subunit SecE [Gammaproteobacteria bacterium]